MKQVAEKVEAGRSLQTGRSRASALAVSGALAAILAVSGCETFDKKDRVTFDGFYFKTKSKPVDKKETLAVFTVEVRDVSQSFDAARKAAEHEGIRYCIENYGNSSIDWIVGPETPAEQLVVDKDAVTFQGRCDP